MYFTTIQGRWQNIKRGETFISLSVVNVLISIGSSHIFSSFWTLNVFQVRTSQNEKYKKYVDTYFSHLLPIFTKLQHRDGKGPIIAYQIENEFGHYGHDPKYMSFLKDLFVKYGLTELYLTSESIHTITRGEIHNKMLFHFYIFNYWF